MPEARKVSGIGFHLPGVYTPRRVGSQISVLRLPHFLHAPTQISKDLEKITDSCDPFLLLSGAAVLTPALNTSTCFSKDAENLTTYGYVLCCSQTVCLTKSKHVTIRC